MSEMSQSEQLKTCEACLEELGFKCFDSRLRKDGSTYLRPICRKCKYAGKVSCGKINTDYKYKRPCIDYSSGYKFCNGCKENKLLECFNFNKTGKVKGKPFSRCKLCEFKRDKEYVSNNRLKVNSKAYKHQHKNKERTAAIRKRSYNKNRLKRIAEVILWRKNHPDKVKRYQAANYKKYSEARKKKTKDWNLKNTERRKVNQASRRARELKAGGFFSAKEWCGLKEKYNNTCLCCNRKEPDIKLTADHVVALSCGGSNFIENIQPLCISCNSSKGIKHIDYRIGQED